MGIARRIFVLVLTIMALAAPAPASAFFAHDANGRLLTASGPWGSGSYLYDALGNMRKRTEGTNSVSTISYADGTNRVTSATIFGQNRTFAYDARGNVANNGKYSFVYDVANQPVSRTGAVNATFAYDGNFKRVKTVEAGETVYSVYSRLGGLLFRYNATDTTKNDDYLRAGAMTVVRITGAGTSYAETFLLADHLGSPLAGVGASGAILWRESYRPFGRTRLDPSPDAMRRAWEALQRIIPGREKGRNLR